MDIKVIRAEKNIFVPNNPEKPDKNSMRLVSTGLVALVPDSYALPEGSYQDLGKIQAKKEKAQK